LSSAAEIWSAASRYLAAVFPARREPMGMLATVMNCLALEAAIERRGRPHGLLSAYRHAADL